MQNNNISMVFETLKKIFSGFLIFSIISLFLIFVKENLFVSAAENLQIFGEEISGKKGEEKNFQIKVKNFENVAGLQIFLEFDENFLEFKSLDFNKFSSTNGAGEGKLNFIWDDFQNPVSLSDDEKILDLKFQILGESGESEIKFSSRTKFFNSVGDEIFSEKISGKIIETTEISQVTTQDVAQTNAQTTVTTSASSTSSQSTTVSTTSNSSSSGGGGGGGGSLSFETIQTEVEKAEEKKVEEKDEDKTEEKKSENISEEKNESKKSFSEKFYERKISINPEKKLEISKKISEGKIFSDSKNHWAKDFIGELTAAKIFDETENFRPNDGVNRAELAKILVNGFALEKTSGSEKNFSDVEKNSWFAESVNILNQNGIADGYSDGTFQPGKVINRAEGLKMVLVAKGIENFFEGENNFDDVPGNSWFEKYVNFAVENGIVGGKSAKIFDPSGKITRAEISKIISLVNKLD